MSQRRTDGGDPTCIDINQTDTPSIAFETAYFEGRSLIQLKGVLPECSYFSPEQSKVQRKRFSRIVVQGYFKQTLGMHQVVSGQQFSSPISVPVKPIVAAGLKVLRLLSPGVKIDVTGAAPYSLAPLAATAQKFHIGPCRAECTPEMADELFFNPREDTSGAGRGCPAGGEGKSVQQQRRERKQWFSKWTNAAKCAFRTDVLYTFEFYDDKLRMATHELGELFQVSPQNRFWQPTSSCPTLSPALAHINLPSLT